MAARVTKLFLQQHRGEHATAATAHGAGKSSGKVTAAKLVELRKKPAAVEIKKAIKHSKKPAAKRITKPKEHFLEAARRELAQADRTRENVRLLRTKTPAKTQKLMAKALAQRQAMLR